ncbi:MAG: putative cytokinetic ring protein SteA [Coriobacteriia bacterium]|jgi:uncharacterized membrane-anchored protein|nr:putative cytokinetic ring protein SteA [Coriobacteriia bacterium]
MRYVGKARLDKRTKDLVKRLGKDDIAIIDHVDMDRVSAEGLLHTGVEVVVNASKSISGSYPNVGPLILARAGVQILDGVGASVFDKLQEGDVIEVSGEDLVHDGAVIASGERLTVSSIEEAMERAKASLGERLDEFARNTLEFLGREKALLTEGAGIPETRTVMSGRHVLVVVRGYDYREDLQALSAYIREMRPVLIGVDGGADAIREAGFAPDIIVGDMDSVTDEALRSGAEIIAHAYADGRSPAMERIHALGLSAIPWSINATSEDLALLLAYESGADLIVAVGTHANLVEYLDKGRKGMASTFLVRLKVGPRLVDAKGVSKLYRTSVRLFDLVLLVGAALVVMSVIVMISPDVRAMLGLMLLRVRAWMHI